MDELTIIYILTFVIVIGIPLFGIISKNGAKLFKDVKIAMEDGKLTEEEINLILSDTGILLRSIVRLIGAITR